MNTIVYYGLAGFLFVMCLVPCADICSRFHNIRKNHKSRTLIYGYAIFLGMSIWTCATGLFLYMADNTYRSGVLFMALFVAATTISLLIGMARQSTVDENSDCEKKKKILRGVACANMAIGWAVFNLVYNYFINIVLSTAFFMSENKKALYAYLLALFLAGGLVIFASDIIINPDGKEYIVHKKEKKKKKEEVYVPKAARNLINHNRKKKKKKRR